MKLFLAALTIWSFSFLGISCGSASVQEPETAAQKNEKPAAKSEPSPTPAGEPVTLSWKNPTGTFLLPAVLLKKPPQVLEVSVTKVVNPASQPITIFVYLSPRNQKADAADNRIEVGNFSLYPVDRPAKFLLDAAALGGVSERRKVPAAKEWQLEYKLERTGPESSSPLEVTIAPPTWKSDKN